MTGHAAFRPDSPPDVCRIEGGRHEGPHFAPLYDMQVKYAAVMDVTAVAAALAQTTREDYR
jgi:hypothetical protein